MENEDIKVFNWKWTEKGNTNIAIINGGGNVILKGNIIVDGIKANYILIAETLEEITEGLELEKWNEYQVIQ